MGSGRLKSCTSLKNTTQHKHNAKILHFLCRRKSISSKYIMSLRTKRCFELIFANDWIIGKGIRYRRILLKEMQRNKRAGRGIWHGAENVLKQWVI
jgi:hypothetical protein